MRRLPIYLLLDCSESMAGPPLEAVNDGLVTFLASLRKNPHALELTYLSFITFDAKARQLFPLTEVAQVSVPRLSIHPGTSLGAGLDLLRERIIAEVVKNTTTTKGDYRPLVFLLTDGQPTDDWLPAAKKLAACKPRLANLVAIGCGDEVDFQTLGQITTDCFHMKDMSTDKFIGLFQWLSDSVIHSSLTPDAPAVNLKKNPKLGIDKINPDTPPPGPRKSLYFHICCQQTRQYFLAPYRLDADTGLYLPREPQRLPEDFFSEGTRNAPSMSADKINLINPCPYCGNPTWAHCDLCKHLFCFDNRKRIQNMVCPVCESKLTLGEAPSSLEVTGSIG